MRSQHGTVHRRQAVGCGVGPAVIARRLRKGIWEQVHPEVYAAAGVPITHEARCWAAWLAVRYGTRDGARCRQVAVSGLAAAAVLGMVPAEPLSPVEISVPLGAAVPRLRDVRVRRISEWSEVGVTKVRGLLVTNRTETSARLAALLSDGELHELLQEELFHRRVTLARLARRRRVGRAGSARLGRVIDKLEEGSDSALHTRGVGLLIRIGLPRPECGVALVPGMGDTDCVLRRVGATGPPYGIVVEWDGAQHRTSRSKYLHGLRKRRALERAGWVVFRYTQDDLEDPTELIRDLLAEHARQRALPPEGDRRLLPVA